MKHFILLLVLIYHSSAIFYDSYHGTTITRDELKRRDKSNTTFWCTIDIAPCDPQEGRRVDGSCNNLDNPTKGTGHTAFLRVLPAVFEKDFEPRKAVSGNDLPLARHLRTRFLAEGHVPSQRFTQLAIHYLVFMSGDIVSQQDTVNYIAWKPYCCAAKGKTDYACVPNKIPDDDPVHRFSNIRCLNMTRPATFQSVGCIGKGSSPERIVSSTPLFDLSTIYGNSEKVLSQKFRMLKGGLLKYELVDGKIWPPSTKSNVSVCFLNDRPTETRCHDTPDDGTNTLAGINLFSIWSWRHHNLIAGELVKVNPCWDDQKLFDTARDINIATALQIYYYEMMPLLLGKENLERDGVLTPTLGFRDIYNSKVLPQMSLEYPYVLRWLHTLQEGALKMYDTKGAYLKQIPIVNLTLRTGYFEVDDNMIYMTQGSFRQGGAAADYVVDPDIAEVGLGPHQKASDLPTNDLAKSRYFGFQPYIKYREFCFGKAIGGWGDLKGIIDPERIEILKNTYESIQDIDLLAGIWLEKHIPGGTAPATFYCLVIDQLLRNIVSDRHWYERPDRPNAFTFPQLLEIRKRTIAGVLCDVGDSVSKIQPNAFSRIGPDNSIVDCSQIGKFDYSIWKDPTCGQPVHWNTYGS